MVDPFIRCVCLGVGLLALACGDPPEDEAGDSESESSDGDDDGDGNSGDGDGDGAPEGPELPPGACMVDGVLADNWRVYEDGALVRAIENGVGDCVAWVESNTIESNAGSLHDELPPVELPARAMSLE